MMISSRSTSVPGAGTRPGRLVVPDRRVRRAAGAGALGLAVLLVAACGGGEDGDAGGGSKPISFVTQADLGIERELYTEFIAEFEEETGLQVKVSFESVDDYLTKLPTLLAAGTPPDVIHQHIRVIDDYASRGALSDLSQFIEDSDEVARDDFVPELMEPFVDGDALYGIPKDSASWGMYINTTMFDAAGVPFPAEDWTLEDFEETAKLLTLDAAGRNATDPAFDAGSIQQWGFSYTPIGPTRSESIRGIVKAFGGDWYSEDQSEATITSDGVVGHFEMFNRMACVDQTMSPADLNISGGDAFRAGRAAMGLGFHYTDFYLRQEGAEFEWDVTYMPAGPGGQFIPLGTSGWAIPERSGNKDAAWQFIEYLTSAEVQERIGEVGRWGVSRPDFVQSIVPDDAPAGFTKIHTDPLQGDTNGREVLPFKFPANHNQLVQVWNEHIDPLVVTCTESDVPGALAAAKADVDEILSQER